MAGLSFGVVFLAVLVLAAAGGATGAIRSHRPVEVAPGVAANERISAVTGALLMMLAAGIGVTILRIGDFLPEHYLVGFLMIGPIGLKLGSTGYRFLRYYTGSTSYRRVGPPQFVLRLSAPFLVAATVALFATGIELWLFGDRFGAWWSQAHAVSFLTWTVLLAVHLLGHTRRSAAALWEEVGAGAGEAITPRGLVIGSLLLGVVLAALSLLYASPFTLPTG